MKINEISKQSPLEEGVIGKKVVPAIGFVDAGIRGAQGDYTGAGIATLAGGLGMVPTLPSQAASVSLDVLNQLRDYAKEKGGWKALGKEYYDSIKNQEYDPSFLPEGFEELDRLERAGRLDEAGLRDILFNPRKYGSMAMDFLRNLRKSKPDSDLAADASRRVEPKFEPPATPKAPDKGPINVEKEFERIRAEKAAAEKAEAEAAKAAAEKKSAEEIAAQAKEVKRKPWESDRAFKDKLDKLPPEVRAKYLQDLADLEKIPKSTLQKAGDKVLGTTKDVVTYPFRHPIRTTLAAPSVLTGLGTGYYYMQDPDAGLGTAFGRTLRKGAEVGADVASGAIFGKPKSEVIKDIHKAAEKSNLWSDQPDVDNTPQSPSADSSAEKPAEAPAEKPSIIKKEIPWQGKAPADKEKEITERYAQFLNDAEEKPSYSKDQYIGWAKKYSEQYGVPLSMVLHAMFKETGWLGDAEKMRTARSPTGARGVMQIQPEYAEKGAYKIKVKDLTDPEKNIEAGVRGLAYYYNKYKTPEKALAAYNAGEGGASSFLKTGDVNTLRTKETRNYIKGFKDNVIHQLEKFYPRDKQKVAQVATDVLATAVGAGNAQAADEIPTAQGGPEKVDRSGKTPRAPNAAELAKLNKQLQNYKDPVKELEKIAQQEKEIADRVAAQQKKAEELKQQYEKEKSSIKDEPGTVRIGPVKITAPAWLTGKDEKSTKKSAVPKEVPAVDDFGNVIEPVKITKKSNTTTQKSKPAGSTTTVTDTQGRSVTYTKNEKGQWVSPDGQMLPMPGQNIEPQADAKPKTQQSVSGTIQRSFGPSSPKADSDLTKPAAGVSAATVAPKSEPPVAVVPSADRGEKKAKTTTNKVVSEPKDEVPSKDSPAADASSKEKVNVRKEFEKAFAAARAKQMLDTGKGSGGTFTFKNPVTGKEAQFTTDYADEVTPKAKVSRPSQADLDASGSKIGAGYKAAADAQASAKAKLRRADDIDRIIKQLDDQGDTAPVDTEDDLEKLIKSLQAEPVKVDKPADVLRSTDGTPVKSGSGDPWGTGTSNKQDIERAKAELQQKIDAEKAKKDLQAVSPDLTPKEPSFLDRWNQGIDTLTGNRRPPDDRETIRVPESVNTELQDILWLAGRTKK